MMNLAPSLASLGAPLSGFKNVSHTTVLGMLHVWTEEAEIGSFRCPADGREWTPELEASNKQKRQKPTEQFQASDRQSEAPILSRFWTPAGRDKEHPAFKAGFLELVICCCPCRSGL